MHWTRFHFGAGRRGDNCGYAECMNRAPILALLVAHLAYAEADPAAVLIHAHDKALQRAKDIPNYTCVENIERLFFEAQNPSGFLSCNNILGARKLGGTNLVLKEMDRLRLEVKVSAGREIGAWLGASRFDAESIFEMAGDGPFATGPLGTLIADIFANAATRFGYTGLETLNGSAVLRYGYDVPRRASHYEVKASFGWIKAAFSGALWIDPETFEVRMVSADTHELLPETRTCDAGMKAYYEQTQIGNGEFLLPHDSQLHFVMRDASEINTNSTFSGCHEYSAASTIHFDGNVPPNTPTAPRRRTAFVVGVGLEVTITLSDPIDTKTAAAGDPFTATVTAVRKQGRSGATLPIGAIVHGRIVAMRRFYGQSSRFEISFLPETIEVNGLMSPFYASNVDGRSTRHGQVESNFSARNQTAVLPRIVRSRRVGTYNFWTSDDCIIVPAGYATKWITTKPKR